MNKKSKYITLSINCCVRHTLESSIVETVYYLTFWLGQNNNENKIKNIWVRNFITWGCWTWGASSIFTRYISTFPFSSFVLEKTSIHISCYVTNSKNRRKDRSTTSKSTSLRGWPPLHYTNEQFLDDTNETTSFLHIRV